MSRIKQSGRSAGRRRWLAASSLALATAMLQPVPAAAQTTTTQGQAVKARATYNTGQATYTPGAAADLVTVQTTDLLINWVPDDTATGGGPISFLPAGNGLFFTFDGTNYTVVNRIIPTDATRAIRFDGQVASFANGFSAIGGNIFFYSPGGIIVGGTGRFDVGSLVLTTSDITSTGTTLGFAASNPGSFVRIEPFNQAGDSSPQIELGNAGSYLAIVAPRIEQRGQVSVNGSIAYVAAESATLTINSGLFDIVVGTGTGDANGIVHTGSTTGPSSTGAGDPQRTYLTAISKNDAITMLVTGQLGYAQAATATADNGSIQLLAQTQNPSGGGSIEVGATDFSADVLIAASDTISLTADGIGNDINFGSATNRVDVDLFALNQIDLNATSGGNVTVFGDLTMYAGNFTTGGLINITVDDVGRNDDSIVNGLTVVGDFSASVNATGSSVIGAGSIGGDAAGGTINVDVNTGGDVFFRSNVIFDASAQAGFGEGQVGSATGGNVNIAMTGVNSRFGMTGEFGVEALIDTSARAAVNPIDGSSTTEQGGVATGGNVTLSLLDGISQFGNLAIDTLAEGSSGTNGAVAQDNAAFAGDVTIDFSGGTHGILGALTIDASSTAGFSFDAAGNPIGGTTDRALVDIGIDGGDVTIGAVAIDASTDGNISGAAPGDSITFAATNGATFLTTSFSADASHNNRESAEDSRAGGIAISADGSSLELGDTALTAGNSTVSGVITRASNKRAGDVSLSATGGSSIIGGSLAISADVVVRSSAVGAAEHIGGDVTLLADASAISFAGTFIDTTVDVPRGGDMSGLTSTGGAVLLQQFGADAAMSLGNLGIATRADGSFTADDFVGDGGNAAGGEVTIDVRGGTFTSSPLTIDTAASGHIGGAQVASAGDTAGSGGSARAGDITLIAAGESVSTGRLTLFASAIAGDGGRAVAAEGAVRAGDGGAATGGTVDIQALAGDLNIANASFFLEVAAFGPSPIPIGALVVNASAAGGTGGFGSGTAGGDGGDATGGTATFTVDGGTVSFTTPTLALVANATGGSGGDTGTDDISGADGGAAGTGGDATGGTASYAITGGGTNLTSVTLDASATGGTGGSHSGSSGGPVAPGGAGGDAFGGSTTVTLGVDDATGASYLLNSTASGGAGGIGAYGLAGGTGRGGSALFTVANAAVDLGSLVVDASGLGGAGGVPGAVSGTGGDGGEGVGGSATIDVFGLAGALTASGGIEITSTGQGGAGAAGYQYFGGADGGTGGAGGAGTGGAVAIAGRDGAALALSTTGQIDARGIGGAGGAGGYSYDGNGGVGGDGGVAFGGAIDIGATGGGSVDVTAIETVSLLASASGGLGGDGGQQQITGILSNPGANGAGTGGAIGLLAQGAGSTLTFASELDADASVSGSVDSRANSRGADATGGSITLDVTGGGAFVATENARFDATALATIGRLTLGNATGGTIDFSMAGADSSAQFANALTLDVSAFEQRTGAFSFVTATGGDTTGGAVTLDFADGTATIAGDLLISAVAGFETSDSAGTGGTAMAGDVSIFNDGAAVVSVGNLVVEAFARGSVGSYYGEGGGGGPGGYGGDAFGGNVLISNQGAGSLTATSLSIDSGASGGRGGDGSGGDGGMGGNGTAGTANVINGSDFAVQDLTIVANGLGGIGGRGSSGFASGIGGQGIGGAVSLSTATMLPPLNTLTLGATGTGGSGNTSSGDSTTGGDGSQGGDGVGGSVLFELTGAGTVLPDVAEFSVDVTGIGGSGGYGSYGYTNGGTGGDGGSGTGGTLTFASRSGAAIELTGFISTLSANGVGGMGGMGGTGGYGDGVSGAGGGTGGGGGFGTGGTLNLVGQGGAIVSGDIELTATGTGGDAGAGGYGYDSAPGTDGANGGGAGGLVTIQALEGSPGVITLGAATIDASGFAGGGDITIPTTGGSIAITDASTDPAGLITMGSLTATALGAVAPADASFTMSGDSGPITVTGSAIVNVVGSIAFDFAATGQLVVGGATTLTAGGDIALTHTGNSVPTTSIDSAGNFTAIAGGDFVGGAGSIVDSGAALTITAQNISYGSLSADTNLTLNALNGSIIGIAELLALGTIDLDATDSILIEDAEAGTGFTADAGGDIAFNVIVNSNNDLTINAGGSVSGGSAINDAPAGSGGSDSVIVNAADDLTLTGTAQSLDDSVVLTAGGGITAGTLAAGERVQAIAGGAVSIGTVSQTGGGFIALLQGTSVTLDSGILTGSLRLNATDGAIVSGGTIAVGQTVDLDATGDIVFGSIAAGTGFTADAGGSIAFDDASTADNNLVFVAGGGINGGSASNLAANGSGGDDSVSLTAGGDVTLTGTSRAENSIIVRGANIAIAAVNAATGGVGALDVQGSGAVSVDDATTGGAASALIQGASVALGAAAIGGNLGLNATSGDLGTTGTVTVGGASDFDATGNIALGSVASGAGFTADAGGDITFVDVSTADNNLTFVAGGSISGNSARNLAPAGSGGDDSVSLTAGGDVTLTGPGRAENSFIVRGANIDLATINAALAGVGAIDIRGTGAANVASATTGGAASALIEGASVTLVDAAIGGNLRLNAIAGAVAVTGAVTIGGAADFDATGNIVFGSITAGTGFTADAGGDILFTAARTNDNNLIFVAGGDIAGTSASNLAANGSGGDDSVSLTAGGDVTLTGTSRAENSFTVRGTNFAIAAVNAATGGSGGLDIQATAAADVGDATTGGNASALIQGASVALDNATIGGNLRLNATAGNLAIDPAGTVTIGGAADFDATGNIVFGTITAGAGFTANAGNDILFVEATTANDNLVFVAGGDIAGTSVSNLAANGSGGDDSVSLTAGGDVTLTGTSRAENSFTVRGANVAIGMVNAATAGSGGVDIRATDAATVGTATIGGNASALIEGADVTLDNGAIGGNLRLNATAGDVNGTGIIAIGGAADFDATGSIAFGSITAGTGFTANAGGDIGFVDAATSDNNLIFVAGGDIAGNSASNLAANGSGGDDSVSLTAGGNVTLTGTSRAENSFTVRGVNITIAAVNAATGGSGGFDVQAADAATVGNAATGGSAAALIEGADVTLDNGDIGGNLRLNATAGDINGTGVIAVGGTADFDATGNINFGSITAGAGFTADAGGDLNFVDAATSDNNLIFVAGGDIAGNSASNLAGNGSGGDDSVSLTAGGNVTLTGTNRAENGFTVRGTNIAIAAVNAATGGGGALDIQAVASAGIGSATTGGSASALIEGADVALDSGAIGGDLRLNATAGDIGGTGAITVGGAADLDATGNIAFGSIAAGAGFTANAGGDIAFGDASTADNNLVFVAGGDISGNSASNLAANGSGGNDAVSLTAGGDVTLTGTSRAENSYIVRATNVTLGALNGATGGAGTIDVQATGVVAVGSVTTGGAAAASFSGTAVTLGGGAIGGDLTLAATSGGIAAGGAIAVGGAADLAATGDVLLGSIAAGGALAVDAGGTLAAQSATAGDALDLRAGSTLTIGDAIGGTVALRSTGGAVIVTNDIDSTFVGDAQQVIVSGAAVQIDDVNDLILTLVQATDGDIDATAAGDIGVATAESAGDINLASTGGDVGVGIAEAGKVGIVPAGIAGAIGPAGTEVGNPGPGHISVSAAGLAQGRFIATGDITIAASTTIDLDGADAGGSIALDSGGSTRVFGTAAAGADIDIQSGGDVRVANSDASLEAGGDLAVNAQGVFDTQGFAYGASVSIRAADVVIGSSGQVGDSELTGSVTFTSIGGPVTLGGEGATAGFALDADEFGRIRNTGDLSIFARSEDGKSVSLIVRDLELAAGSGGAMGSGSALLLDSEGEIDVLGALTVSQAGGEATIRLRSNGRTWLDTAGGNLRIEDAGGAPTGVIDIGASRFIAASEDALVDIEGLSAADIDARLAQNDGVVRDEGFLQAGALEVLVDDALLIQNSGESTEFDDRRGFTVDFLAIESSESANPLIVINGTVDGATGADALAAIEIAGGLEAGSTVNGCLIANPANCAALPPSPEIDFFDPARDVIEEEIDPGLDPDALDEDLASQLIDFTMPEEFEDDPLIDDPVTGAGNEDLWLGEPECEPGEGEGGVCPVTEGEEVEPAE